MIEMMKYWVKEFDIVGREIAVLVDGFQNAGKHEVSFNLGNIKVDEITSGIYLYKLQTHLCPLDLF